MSDRDSAIFDILHLFIWIRFVTLKLISTKTLVSNFFPSILRGKLAVFPEFSVMLYLSRNLHGCFIHDSVSSIPYVLKGIIKSG